MLDVQQIAVPLEVTSPRRRLRARRARRGTDLFSAVLYLVAFVVVIAGLIALYTSVMNGIRGNQLTLLHMRAVSTVENAYRSQASYESGDLLVILKVSGNFSDKEVWKVSDGVYAMRSPYNTAMTVTGSGTRTVTIGTAALPPAACTSLLEAMIDPGRRVSAVTVNGTALTMPATSTAVGAACDGATDDLYDVAVSF